jgi:hypothetical protein
MLENYEKALNECKKMLKNGANQNDILFYLHSNGASVIEAIKVLKVACDLPIGKAKLRVTTAPFWSDVVESSDALHEELLEATKK